MTAPMRVIRGFIGPVVAAAIRTAQKDQHIGNDATKVEAGREGELGSETLLDYLVQVLVGKTYLTKD